MRFRLIVSFFAFIASLVVVILSFGQGNSVNAPGHNKPSSVVPTPTPTLTGFGALISGVTAYEKNAWGQGRIVFQEVEAPQTGSGQSSIILARGSRQSWGAR
jgi:hypothetical protein